MSLTGSWHWRHHSIHSGDTKPGIRAVVVVPTNELCDQVKSVFQSLLHYCADVLTLLALTSDKTVPLSAHVAQLREKVGLWFGWVDSDG